MPALRVDLANVQLAQPSSELLKNKNRFAHSWIDLMDMADVKAERSLWESFENSEKIAPTLPNRLPLVHIFNAHPRTQFPPRIPPPDNVGMRNQQPLDREMRRYRENLLLDVRFK
jgi:hypothetical protein